jgi:hypothetical protein
MDRFSCPRSNLGGQQEDKEVLMRVMDEKLTRAGLFLSLAILGVGMAACGGRRLNVMSTPQETLMAIGYSADRSDSIFRANNDAQYSQRRRQGL